MISANGREYKLDLEKIKSKLREFAEERAR